MQTALYVWQLLSISFVGYVSFDFLLCAVRKNGGSYLALWLVVAGVLTLILTRFNVSALPLYAFLLAVFVLIVLKLKFLEIIAPISVLFTLYTLMDSFSAVLNSWAVGREYLRYDDILTQVIIAFFADICFFFVLCIIRKRFFHTFGKNISPYLYMLLLPGTFMLIITRTVLRLCRRYSIKFPPTIAYFAALTVLFFAAALFFPMLMLFRKIINRSEQNTADALLREQFAWQKMYISEARKRNAQFASQDYDNTMDLLALSSMMNNKFFTEAERYVDKLLIKCSRKSYRLFTGSLALDVLLKEKLSYAARSGIKTSCKVRIPVGLEVDDTDLCVIFSGVMDNAVKACMSMPRQKRFIALSTKGLPECILIEAVNSVITSKPVRIGTGLACIGKLADKYNGTVQIESSRGVFRIAVTLFASNKHEDSMTED